MTMVASDVARIPAKAFDWYILFLAGTETSFT